MTTVQDAATIAQRLVEGDRSALARLISWAENAHPAFPAALAAIYPRVGRSWRIGLTGPPGAGKSTLANRLVERLREQGHTVGVLAIDPSSPFSGGALLGDRIRMEERTTDAGVYIRSMATREAHGGLARAAFDACDVMDAFGFDYLLVETVGVGQAEYEVVSATDTVLVIMCPGAGDGIQAMKAGILEVADVLVVSKADLSGADQLHMDLEEAVLLRAPLAARGGGWKVPVVSVSALPREPVLGPEPGTLEILEAVAGHRRHLEAHDLAARRREQRVAQVRRVVRERLEDELWGAEGFAGRVETALRSSPTPYDVAEEILSAILDRKAAGSPQAQGGNQATPGIQTNTRARS